MECKWTDFCMFSKSQARFALWACEPERERESEPNKVKALSSYAQRNTIQKIAACVKVPWGMNLNVNIHRKTYFNIYQNENGNLSLSEIERTEQNWTEFNSYGKKSTEKVHTKIANIFFLRKKNPQFFSLPIGWAQKFDCKNRLEF